MTAPAAGISRAGYGWAGCGGGTAAGRSARRAARRVRCRGLVPVTAVGCWPMAVPGPDAVIVKGGLHLAAGGPGLAARAVGQLGHPLGHLPLGRLDEPGRLLHGGAVLRLARELDQLLVALPAGPGAQHEANAEANDEHESVPHLAPHFRE